MGNCFAKRDNLVQETEAQHLLSRVQRVRVRIPIEEYKELVSQADGAEMGQLILQECLKGKYQARVLGNSDNKDEGSQMVKGLETIKEN